MNRLRSRRLALALAATLLAAAGLGAGALPARAAEPRLAHMVFFTLKDRSEAARQKLVASCKTHLTGHEGTVSFSVGTIAEDVVEPVSVRDFDVALHLVFASKAAADAYHKSPRHSQFVAENRTSWSQVRVFDSYLAAP